MTYAKYESSTAADFNTFVGDSNSDTAYASSAAATNKVAALFGVGYGDRGYGQTVPSVSRVQQYETANSGKTSALITALQTMANHQGTAVNLPSASTTSYSNVVAYDAASCTPLATAISALDTARLTAYVGAMSLYNNQLTVTRATAWGNTPSGITCEVQADFGSENAARYFFNSGGQIYIALNHANVSSTQNTAWGTICSGVGTIKFGANSTTRTGTLGAAQALGYYQLSTVEQTIFNGTNIGGGSYTANDVMVTAKAMQSGGSTGGKGYQIRFKITLDDQHPNTFSDTVALGTNASISFLKATTYLSGIASPTLTTITNF